MQSSLREAGRLIVEWTCNRCEPDDVRSLPARLDLGGESYRRNRKTPHKVACLFGSIRLRRCVYQAVTRGEAAIFPLERALGIVAHAATPALADVAGRLAADLPQQQALAVLRERCGVGWSVGLQRNVVAALASNLAPLRHEAQLAQLLDWLRKAEESSGKFAPTLSVGRDGTMIPMRPGWEEASTATISVLDREGRRLGTVYLGRMPESGQGTLSDQLSKLLTDLLAAWQGALPRLVYLTDAGTHPQDYFRYKLAWMKHPRTGEKLKWEWTVDYFHACEYVGKLADALFGSGPEAAAWAAKMRRLLKEQPGGIRKLLRRAAAQRRRQGLRGCRKDFDRALNYLRKYRRHMNYADNRRRKLPIGSGVTEAACKTIFGHRFKQSGMRWCGEQGQHVLDLRLILKSGVWKSVRDRWLKQAPCPQPTLEAKRPSKCREKARKTLLPA